MDGSGGRVHGMVLEVYFTAQLVNVAAMVNVAANGERRWPEERRCPVAAPPAEYDGGSGASGGDHLPSPPIAPFDAQAALIMNLFDPPNNTSSNHHTSHEWLMTVPYRRKRGKIFDRSVGRMRHQPLIANARNPSVQHLNF